ncbi:MAG TPA: hypothetical protein VNU94_00645 [Acidobacteriaceae bacterium]|nr:hypothetical protein [Acidobacteriaceae bacterium]
MKTPQQHQIRQQVRGLLWLAGIVIVLSIARAGLHTAFPHGWWRLW